MKVKDFLTLKWVKRPANPPEGKGYIYLDEETRKPVWHDHEGVHRFADIPDIPDVSDIDVFTTNESMELEAKSQFVRCEDGVEFLSLPEAKKGLFIYIQDNRTQGEGILIHGNIEGARSMYMRKRGVVLFVADGVGWYLVSFAIPNSEWIEAAVTGDMADKVPYAMYKLIDNDTVIFEFITQQIIADTNSVDFHFFVDNFVPIKGTAFSIFAQPLYGTQSLPIQKQLFFSCPNQRLCVSLDVPQGFAHHGGDMQQFILKRR